MVSRRDWGPQPTCLMVQEWEGWSCVITCAPNAVRSLEGIFLISEKVGKTSDFSRKMER